MDKREFIKKGLTYGMGSLLFSKVVLNQMMNTNLLKPGAIHFELYKLINAIKNDGDDVEIDEQQIELFERYMVSNKFQEKFDKFLLADIEELKSLKNISINEDQKIPLNLFSVSIRWGKVDREGPNSPLYGGFAFNQGMAMMLEPTDSWKTRQEDFLEYEESTDEDKELFSDLIWFEGPTFPNMSPFISCYGCVTFDGTSFPHKFYFYDGGVIYPLPFTKYADYIRALIANFGVECWQYFYIDPKLLVSKNRGLNYMTTDLRKVTRLVEDISYYEYNDSYDFDRLDLIYEYLQRVIKFLPLAFPTYDFGHQKVYLKKLERLI